MKKFLLMLITVMLFGSCEKNNNAGNPAPNIIIPPSEIISLNDSANSIENTIEQTFFPTHWTLENLRLRDEPNTEANIIHTLQKGTAVQKIESGRIQNIDNITASWLLVQIEDGEKGWCFGGYLADKVFLMQGIWVDGENGTGVNFYYFTADKALFGIFSSGFYGVCDWTVGDNDIYFNGEKTDHGERLDVSQYVHYAIINYDTIKISDTIFTRISEQDLLSHYTSKDHFDELIERF